MAATRTQYEIVGVTGLNRTGGDVLEEFLPKLRGSLGRKVYREMADNDSIIGGILFAVEMLMRQVDWRMEPYSDEKEDVDAAAFVDECRGDMELTWEDTIAEILTMLPFGWSWMEKCFKQRGGDVVDPLHRSRYNDGRIGWRKWAPRAQDSLYQWQFDPDGGVTAMVQLAPPDYAVRTIPREKSIHFTTTSRKQNPEGRSVLRNAWLSWYYLNNLQRIEAIGVERDLAGLPVALVPAEILAESPTAANLTTLNHIKSIIRNIRRDEQEGVVFPQEYDDQGKPLFELKLLSTGGARQFNTDVIIQRYRQSIAMVVLADFVLLGHEQVGSFALASSKTEIFSFAIGAWLDSIAATINNGPIPELLRLNGWQVQHPPKLVHGDLETVDPKDLAQLIQSVAGAGMPLFPDDKLENYIRGALKMPAKEESEAA